jgi:tRNA (guanine6-N2)-methyltransferase
MKFMATTVKGLEDIAGKEIEELGGCFLRLGSERVFFEGNIELIYKLNLRCRCLHKLILLLIEGKATSLKEIYEIAKSVDYNFLKNKKFAVRTTRVGSHNYNSCQISATIGQAILDSFGLEKPKVDLENPDIEIFSYVKDDEVNIGINTTGESMHKRNYRVYDHPAALRTTIACGMIKISNWNFKEVFLDPMCGGGTIPIEAALMARNIPPGIFRKDFAFKKLSFFDENSYKNELEKALKESNNNLFNIYAFDISKKHIEGAILNSKSANVYDTINFSVRDATREESYKGIDAKYIVLNPPYGIRQSRIKIIEKLYREFFNALKNSLCGATIVLITAVYKVLEKLDINYIEVRDVKHGDLPAKIYKINI